MRTTDLNNDQMIELKQNFFCNVLHEGEDVSYYELANVDSLVPDEEVHEFYADVCFVNDDFFCSVDK